MNGPAEPAVVLRVAGREALVEPAAGGELLTRLRVGLEGGPPVAGDRVLVERPPAGEPVVVRIEPRSSLLRRGLPRGRTRPIAANADLLVVVAAVAEPEPHPRFIDRYLVAGELGGLAGALVLTKRDLPHDSALVGRLVDLYAGIGYPVLAGSARDPTLVADLAGLIGDRLAVLAGHSGVGKSTLTQALTGVARETAAVSGKAGTGRHTTTDPRLVRLPGRGAVIDTAGVRTFHLPSAEPADLARGFPEIATAARGCRFRGCRHDGDAGCAVAEAVSPERLDSYRRLLHGR